MSFTIDQRNHFCRIIIQKCIQHKIKENISTLRYKGFKKNVYIDRLDNIVNEHKNTYHSKIKMKPVDVKSSTYINSS